MASTYNKSASRYRKPKGYYAAIVTRLVGEDVYVKVPKLSNEFEHGPIPYVGAVPMVGDEVFAGFLLGDPDTVMVVFPGGGDTEPPIQDSFLIASTTYPERDGLLAVADYICDGVDDHLAFQAAVDELGSNGGTIWIATGYYFPKEGIDLTGAGPIWFRGTGWRDSWSTLIEVEPDNGDVAYDSPVGLFGASDAGGSVTFTDLDIYVWWDGPVPVGGNGALLWFPNRAVNVDNCVLWDYDEWIDSGLPLDWPIVVVGGGVFNNVDVESYSNGIEFTGEHLALFDVDIEAATIPLVLNGDVTLERMYAESYEYTALTWDGVNGFFGDIYFYGYTDLDYATVVCSGENAVFRHCYVYNDSWSEGDIASGISIDGGKSVIVDSCYFEGGTACLSVEDISESVIIRGNQFDWAYNFIIARPTMSGASISVTNNACYYPDGSAVKVGAGYGAVVIAGNRFNQPTYREPYVPIVIDGCSNFVVSNNLVSDN